nr:SBBP repeat-containing protein [Bacteroidota bacterium]
YTFINTDNKRALANPGNPSNKATAGIALKEKILGSRSNTVSGEMPTQAKVNYFKGADPLKWQREIPTFDRINLGEIYEGIDLKIKAFGKNVEKLFFVQPGADPGLIQLSLSGANALEITDSGELAVETGPGTIVFTRPVAYQEIEGEKTFVDVAYWINNNTYGFSVGDYDPSNELVIDPLIASTFLGGHAMDGFLYAYATVDDEGYVYITGVTKAANFPVTPGAYDPGYNFGDDVFITKFTSDLTKIESSTYFGGIEDDCATSLIFDNNGNVFIAGYTGSRDLPITGQPYDSTYNGDPNGLGYDWDVFVAKFDHDMQNLLVSTYLGGYDQDGGYHTMLNMDPATGNIIVGGATYSSDFPTTPGAFCNTINFVNDIFVSIFDDQLHHLLASTLIGSNGWDECLSVQLDSDGNICFCGEAGGSGFPTTPGAYQENFVWYGDAFVAKFNISLDTLVASTYIGGGDTEGALDLALSQNGDVIIAGFTESADYPVTPGAYDESFNGDHDIFISKFSGDLTKLNASTYLGGNDIESFWGTLGMVMDEEENIFVSSGTFSEDFPVTPNAYNTFPMGDEDVFVSKFDPDLVQLTASTLIGGKDDEFGIDIMMLNNNVLVVGQTWSEKFPVTTTAFDTSYNYTGDLFLSIFDGELSSPITGVSENTNRNIPDGLTLHPNYPNPFLYHTNITFILSESCLVELAIYDVTGNRVKSLINNKVISGRHTVSWDRTNNQGESVAPGIYVYKIKAGNFIDSKHCVVLRN